MGITNTKHEAKTINTGTVKNSPSAEAGKSAEFTPGDFRPQ